MLGNQGEGRGGHALDGCERRFGWYPEGDPSSGCLAVQVGSTLDGGPSSMR